MIAQQFGGKNKKQNPTELVITWCFPSCEEFWGFGKTFAELREEVKLQHFHRTQTALSFSCPSKRAPSQEKQD